MTTVIPIPYPQHTRLTFLKEEVKILKQKLRPHDTGHINTTIGVLNEQIDEIKEILNYETK